MLLYLLFFLDEVLLGWTGEQLEHVPSTEHQVYVSAANGSPNEQTVMLYVDGGG